MRHALAIKFLIHFSLIALCACSTTTDLEADKESFNPKVSNSTEAPTDGESPPVSNEEADWLMVQYRLFSFASVLDLLSVSN